MSTTPLEHKTDERELFNELQLRVDNSQIDRAKREKDWRDAELIVNGDQRHTVNTGKHHYFTVNRVRTIVDVHTAIMTETPSRVQYAPKEVGEPADWFLKPEAVEKLGDIPGHGLTDEQLQGTAVIPDEHAQWLLQATRPHTEMVQGEDGMVMPVEQQVPILTAEDFVVVTDQLSADALTQEVDSQWQMADGDQILADNIFETQVVGHCDALVEWDAERHLFRLNNLYRLNCWIDPLAKTLDKAEYFIVREFLPVSEAKRLFPDHADYIERNAGMPTSSSVWTLNTGDRYSRTGARRMIDLWTWWQRDHPYDVPVDEALESGLVEPAMQEVESEVTDPETGEIITDETGSAMREATEQPVVTDDGEQVYRIAGSDSLVMPGDEEWPKRSGVRQVQFLRNQLIYDEETDFSEIPVARNRAMMLVDTTYGQGEPKRLAELNDLYNRLYSIYHDYFKAFRSPEQAVPRSVYESTKEAVETLHASASKKWIIDDELWMQYGGNVIHNITPPNLGTVISDMMAVVDREIDKVAGLAEVLRGETKSEQSGELFKAALNAARGPIGLKARNTASMLRRIGTIVANLIIDFMPADEWAKRNRKYPPQILEAMRQRIRRVGFNVVVEVAGSGSREDKIANEMELWQAGVRTPTLLRSILENRGIADANHIVQEFQQMSAPAPQ